jgi:CRP/FNR family cyclic AMP-dependent transcriptional regulator
MVSAEQLRRYPFFAGMTDEELDRVAQITDRASYEAGAVIFREGEVAQKLYVLTDGSVELVYEIPKTEGMTTSFVGSIAAGEPFGLSAFNEPYLLTATARAESAVNVLEIPGDALRALAEEDCHLGYALMKQIARALGERLSFARVQLAACMP